MMPRLVAQRSSRMDLLFNKLEETVKKNGFGDHGRGKVHGNWISSLNNSIRHLSRDIKSVARYMN